MNTRYRFLDALRGFAVMGILLVNARDITRTGDAWIAESRPDGSAVLDVAVQGRFVPLFAMLFGVTLWLIADGAKQRGQSAWWPLVLRMIALGALGVVHSFAYGGDILREYAVVGLVVIPFAIWVAPWISLSVGIALTSVSMIWGSGGVDAVPGWMLLGVGAAGLGVPAALDRGTRLATILLAVALPVATLALIAQFAVGGDPRFAVEGARAGFAISIVYLAVASLLWQWGPARAVLSAAFEALGRTALTCYVSANVAFALLAQIIDFSRMRSVWPVLACAVTVIVLQAIIARIWLRYFTNGPLEWVVRAVTWRTLPPMRRRPAAQQPAAENAVALSTGTV